jgi:hypothetical protein
MHHPAPVTFFLNGSVYAFCYDCRQLVQIDKKVLGSLHFCLTDCERYGHLLQERRRGFWQRRTVQWCSRCHTDFPAVAPRPAPGRR